MASVFVLQETFNRKGAAALGNFPCATAASENYGNANVEHSIGLNEILIQYTSKGNLVIAYFIRVSLLVTLQIQYDPILIRIK